MGDMIDRDAALAIEGQLAKSMAHFLRVEQWQAYKAGVQEYRDAIAALPAVVPGVKPLEWHQTSTEPARWLGHQADVSNPDYVIHLTADSPDVFAWGLDGDGWHGFCDTLETAQTAAQADYAARILAALEPQPAPDLSDPVTVHANMLRGTIAKPTVEQIVHLYGREAFQPMIDAAMTKALERACLAVSEHADWPDDAHGRTEQVGLFARVINAILAALEPQPVPEHVNETPKTEHDAGNVLTPAPDAAAIREALLSLPAVYAHQINTGVREVYDPLQRFYTMEDVLRALIVREADPVNRPMMTDLMVDPESIPDMEMEYDHRAGGDDE